MQYGLAHSWWLLSEPSRQQLPRFKNRLVRLKCINVLGSFT